MCDDVNFNLRSFVIFNSQSCMYALRKQGATSKIYKSYHNPRWMIFFRYFCPNEHTGKRHNLFSVLSKFQVICLWKASSDSLERRWIDNLYDQQPLWSTTFVIHRPIFWMAGNNINIIMKLRQREWELSWLKSTVEADWPPGHCLAGRSLAVMLSPHQWSMPCPILSPSIPPLPPPLLLLSLMPNELRDRTPQEIEAK